LTQELFSCSSQFGSVDEADLWQSIAAVADLPVDLEEVMYSWTHQLGFPLVTVHRSPEGCLSVRQVCRDPSFLILYNLDKTTLKGIWKKSSYRECPLTEGRYIEVFWPIGVLSRLLEFLESFYNKSILKRPVKLVYSVLVK
jgi:hypothetical protein